MADSVERKLGEITQWQIDHAKEDKQAHEEDHNAHQEIYARFDIMESNISLLPTKNDIEDVVKKALLDVLFKTGRGTKFWLVTVATVIGAIVVIGGGAKWLLGLIGFSYLSR